jgi:CobQ-like glutamine amidotransferase family enzyme
MTPIHIVHLYAKEMNIYGDNGNVLVLSKRLQWRGIPVKVSQVGVGDIIPKDTSIIIGGGGQDAGQSAIAKDIQSKKSQLLAMRDDGVVMLMICGMYQMFGHYFKTSEGVMIAGIEMLDIHTIAGNKRIIGNIVTKSEWGTLIGYENHSGKTYLGENASQLGIAKPGQGNNGEDTTEGAVHNNVFGSYLHGPMLAKSPQFADELLSRALELKKNTSELMPIDDTITQSARKVAMKRPR